ncbi:MAG: YdeI/OmpD-associated family protein [Devosia sp.]
MTDHPQIEVKSRAELRHWLKANQKTSGSIWLIIWKKPSAHHVAYADIVEEVLCFGWIDSQPRLLDADRSMIRLSPRKPESGWSAVNKRRVQALISSKKITRAGLAVIEEAKRNGAWTLLDAAHAGKVPSDLTAAFERHKGSQDNFEAFPPSARKAILEWIGLAKRAETRASRIEETARLAARGERANQWRK